MAFMSSFLIFAVAINAVTSHRHSFRFGECPKVKVMKEFEMEKFLGEWYVVARYNPSSTCIKINVEQQEDGNLTFTESSKPHGLFFLGLENSSRKPRKITLLSNKTEAIFKLEGKSKIFGVQTFGVIDTNYTDYAIVWGCDPVVVGTLRHLDILSKTRVVKVPFVKEAIAKAVSAGIDPHPLEMVNQKRCKDPEAEDSESGKIDSINNMFVEE